MTFCSLSGRADWNAMVFIAVGSDAELHAPEDGWPEGVTLSQADAPVAALTCPRDDIMRVVMTDEADAAWDELAPWSGAMVLPAGRRVRVRSERPIKMRCGHPGELCCHSWGSNGTK